MSYAADLKARNDEYVPTKTNGQLPLPPSRKAAVLLCMDARVLGTALGFKEGEAHVIRNAGARAPDAIRSLIISQQLLGTNEIVVVGHTDCGMETFTTEQARGLVAKQLSLEPSSEGSKFVNNLEFQEFPKVHANVVSDVTFLKSHELIKKDTKITGWVVRTFAFFCAFAGN
ncbi:hypothetical protein CF327_g5898 [Tilletia walkeri]|uniref:Carbonic anhydrase n=1 Tax=Tilletia walkeri TaxID=117179 RepID=A0A8X7N6W6_9BASI|nr:hypothetical protein CF327_g5898 [Tilletia walkeri]KAE8267724.1 hypothetical protein A4X09_0g4616 [Tilletia walkeri]